MLPLYQLIGKRILYNRTWDYTILYYNGLHFKNIILCYKYYIDYIKYYIKYYFKYYTKYYIKYYMINYNYIC